MRNSIDVHRCEVKKRKEQYQIIKSKAVELALKAVAKFDKIM